MAAPVRIEARAWNDIRFMTLARLLNLADSDHALIKVARLWSWQTEHYTADNPTYAIDRDTIESVLGPDGPGALVRAKLADETPSGWRMRGTEGAIEWCADLSSKRQRAGRARAESARRGQNGRLLGKEDYSEPAHAGGAGPAPTSTSPAQSSAPAPAPAPDPSPDPEIQIGEQHVRPVRSEPTSTHQTLSPAPRRKRPAKRAVTELPEGWQPRQSERDKARESGVDADFEAGQFTSHHTAKGSTFADWDAAFRTWIGNAQRFGRRGGSSQKTALELQFDRIRMLEAEELREKAETS